MKRIYLFLLVILCISGCQPKVRCGSYYIMKRPSGKSEVLAFESKTLTNSANSNISGMVISKMKIGKFPFKKIEVDTLSFAKIFFVDKKTGKLFEQTADIKGKYSFTLPSSNYDFRVKYIGYNALVVKNLSIRKNEAIKLSALLEFGRDSTIYETGNNNDLKLVKDKQREKR